MTSTPDGALWPASPLEPRRLLGVWAHPDDEAYLCAGLMARVRADGGSVTSVAATLGEGGFADDDPRTIEERKAVRAGELVDALRAVGVTDVRTLGFPDGALSSMPRGRLVDAVAEVLCEVRPHVVVTFGSDGMTGHPDHVAIGCATTAAWLRTGVGHLLFATVTPAAHEEFGRLFDDAGISMGGRPRVTPEEDLAIALALGPEEVDRKRAALAAHATQTAALAATLGEGTYRRWIAQEAFRRPSHDEVGTCSAA